MRRRHEGSIPTPAGNRERIVALEAEIERLEEIVNQHQRNLDIQFQRIGQLQADLDAIRDAWVKAKAVRRPQ